MHFTKLILAAATVAITNAVMLTDSSYAGITAGTPFNLTWSGASGPVTILLKNGPASALQTVSSIASGLTGTSYAWTPSASLADGYYSLEIDDSTGVPNYAGPFLLSGGVASAASSSTTSSLPSLSANGTTASTTTSASQTSSSSKASTTTTQASASPLSTTSAPKSAAAGLASPLALVFLALAAIVTLN